MTSLEIKGTERIERSIYSEHLSELDRGNLPLLLKTSPCWGEVAYFNTFKNDAAPLDSRDFLLGWVFAVIEQQYGFALELAVIGTHRFNDPVFGELVDYSLKMVTTEQRQTLIKRVVQKLRKVSGIFIKN